MDFVVQVTLTKVWSGTIEDVADEKEAKEEALLVAEQEGDVIDCSFELSKAPGE